MTSASGEAASRPEVPRSMEPPRMRASDADRESTARTLNDAVARGLLTLDEVAERLGAAYDTRHVDDLARLTADLPQRSEPPRPLARGWRDILRQMLTQARADLSLLTRTGLRSGSRRRAAAVLLVVVVTTVVLATLVAHGLFDGGPEYHGEYQGEFHQP